MDIVEKNGSLPAVMIRVFTQRLLCRLGCIKGPVEISHFAWVSTLKKHEKWAFMPCELRIFVWGREILLTAAFFMPRLFDVCRQCVLCLRSWLMVFSLLTSLSCACSTVPQFYCFISLSLPHTMLGQYLDSVARQGGTVVIKGISPGMSFPTWLMDVIYPLLLQHPNGALEINPVLFTRYRISQVPSFVLVDVTHHDYWKLSGAVASRWAYTTLLRRLKGR